MINDRLKELQALMVQKSISAYIIPSSDPHQSEYVAEHWKSRIWVSGFTGSAGTVVITKDHAGVWTDSRYFIQAEEELSQSNFQLHKLGVAHTMEHVEWLHHELSEGDTVALDGNLFSIAAVEKMKERLSSKKINLQTDVDLMDSIWKDRPSLPKNKIFELSDSFAGESRRDKIQRIREEMNQLAVDFHLLVTLDDIAWTFNIRSNDVECNPVSIAYAVIGKEESFLFIDEDKIPTEIAEALNNDNIKLLPYTKLKQFLSEIGNDKSIALDPSLTSHSLGASITKAKKKRIPSIPYKMKGIKNDTEISHLRSAMIKDGVALTRLYRWLEETVATRPVKETEVATKLAGFRKEQGDYHGESFGAIVGFKGNGAIVHYSAKEETCAEIVGDGMLLLDSGGQYYNGTTDITRTTYFGEPSEEQKRDFTLVLKGHISLASLKFIHGTRGNQMEILARQALWKYGLNYGHGTGHGVGFFLNVHEGPQGFGPGATKKFATVFEVGMLTSNEPGFYKEGEYGIRIENLVVTEHAEKTAYGEFLQFETVTLFPIDQKLINFSLLTKDEVLWLNQYHELVLEKLSPHLNSEELVWMKQLCQPI